jgi:NitT/TauT family transport system ATP-binding protein
MRGTGPESAGSPSGAAIQIRRLRKAFRSGAREILALDGIDLDVAAGELVCLLGPSGCGKSTLLNAIAGFAPPTAGTILAGGAPVRGPGPDRAMVFQEYALFPWMTVEENVAFGLQMKGEPRARIREAVGAWLATGSPKTSPAACASASPSPGCWPSTRRCC